MTFFDGIPDAPREPIPVSLQSEPPWQGPPRGWVGGPLPWHVEIFSGTNLYVALSNVSAFPTGVLFDLDARIRPGAIRTDDSPGSIDRLLRLSMEPDHPRLGFAYTDGRKAIAGRPTLQGPSSASLMQHGGGGGRWKWLQQMWLWPLPPSGPVELAYAWDAAGITERAFQLDGAELGEAAGRAKLLWEVPSGEATNQESDSPVVTLLGQE